MASFFFLLHPTAHIFVIMGKKVVSERHAHLETDAPFVSVWIIEVGESAHIVNLNEFENVVYSNSPFNVGFTLVHADGVLLVAAIGTEVPRKVEKVRVGIVERSRVVAVS